MTDHDREGADPARGWSLQDEVLDDPVIEHDSEPPERWARRTAHFSLRSARLGIRYEIEGQHGDPIGTGWRFTMNGAKRAARRRIRRAASGRRRKDAR